MSKELAKLVSYIEENNQENLFKGKTSDLEALLDELFSGSPNLDLESQKKLFTLSMSCYTLFAYTLMRPNLNEIPELLRYSLLSKCFYSFGQVDTPDSVSEEVSDLLEDTESEWYENDAVGYRIFNLRENVLQNSTLDLAILTEEFQNTGDVGNISSILNNPKCPEHFLEEIINSEHSIIFESDPNEDLIEEAKKILSRRRGTFISVGGFEYKDEEEGFIGLFCQICDQEIGYDPCPNCEEE